MGFLVASSIATILKIWILRFVALFIKLIALISMTTQLIFGPVPILPLIGSILIKVIPAVGLISATIGIVFGSLGKGEKQNKLAVGLIVFNILIPVLCMLVILLIS